MEQEDAGGGADFVTLALRARPHDEQCFEFTCQRKLLQHASSEYLQQLVSGAWSEGQRSRIDIKYECSPANFEHILRFAFGYRSKEQVFEHLRHEPEGTEDDEVNAEEDEEEELNAVSEAEVERKLTQQFINKNAITDWASLALEEDQTCRDRRRPAQKPKKALESNVTMDEDSAWVEKMITRENALSLYDDAQFFQLPELALACETFIAQHIVGFHNVCQYWIASVQADMHILEQNCRAIFKDHFEKLSKQDEFLLVPKELLIHAIKSPYLRVKSENHVWSAVMRWGTYQYQQLVEDELADPLQSNEVDDELESLKPHEKGKEKAADTIRKSRARVYENRAKQLSKSSDERWERGVGPSRKEKANKDTMTEHQRRVLKDRILSDIIQYIRYPLMDYSFLCEYVAPTGLVPQDMLEEAYKYLLYKANGLRGYDKVSKDRSFRTYPRQPKVRMSDVYTATATGGPVLSANMEIVAEVFRWLFNSRPKHASLASLQQGVAHFLKSKSVGSMFCWLNTDQVIAELQRIGIVSVTPPGSLIYNINRDQLPDLTRPSRALSVILEDILLWLRDHPSRPSEMEALKRQVDYYLAHKRINNMFLVDAQRIVQLLVETGRVQLVSATTHRVDRRTHEDSTQSFVRFNAGVDTMVCCSSCFKSFVLAASVLRWYYERRLKMPTRCHDCLKAKKDHPQRYPAKDRTSSSHSRSSRTRRPQIE